MRSMRSPPTVTEPLPGRRAPIRRLTTVDFPQPLSPTIAVIPFAGKNIFTPFKTSRRPSYEKVTSFSSISLPAIAFSPQTGSSSSSRAMIFFPALAPFMAT